jgi:hypothetical protein
MEKSALSRFILICLACLRLSPATEIISQATRPNILIIESNSQPAPQNSATANLKYNVVSIVTDDQALWSIGAYGNREAITATTSGITAFTPRATAS